MGLQNSTSHTQESANARNDWQPAFFPVTHAPLRRLRHKVAKQALQACAGEGRLRSVEPALADGGGGGAPLASEKHPLARVVHYHLRHAQTAAAAIVAATAYCCWRRS